jgi:hypothetical protein
MLEKRIWEHIKVWLDWHGRVSTVLVIITALGGAALANRGTAIWGNVTGLYLWIVTSLVFVIFVAAFLHIRNRAPIEDQTLQAVPHVDLLFELTHNGASSHIYRDTPIFLENTTDHEAYVVQIQPKHSSEYSAEFIPIARLSKGQRERVDARIRLKPTGFTTSIEAICKHDNTPSDAKGITHIPMVIRYQNRIKRQFETVHEIVYDGLLGEARAQLVQGARELKN